MLHPETTTYQRPKNKSRKMNSHETLTNNHKFLTISLLLLLGNFSFPLLILIKIQYNYIQLILGFLICGKENLDCRLQINGWKMWRHLHYTTGFQKTSDASVLLNLASMLVVSRTDGASWVAIVMVNKLKGTIDG